MKRKNSHSGLFFFTLSASPSNFTKKIAPMGNNFSGAEGGKRAERSQWEIKRKRFSVSKGEFARFSEKATKCEQRRESKRSLRCEP